MRRRRRRRGPYAAIPFVPFGGDDAGEAAHRVRLCFANVPVGKAEEGVERLDRLIGAEVRLGPLPVVR